MRMEERITGGKVQEAAVAAVIATGMEEEAHHLGGSRATVKNAVEVVEAGVTAQQVVVVAVKIPGAMTDVALTAVTNAVVVLTAKNAEEEEVEAGATEQLAAVKMDPQGETIGVEVMTVEGVRAAAVVEGLGGVKRTQLPGQTIGAVRLQQRNQLLLAEGTMTATGKLSASAETAKLNHSLCHAL